MELNDEIYNICILIDKRLKEINNAEMNQRFNKIVDKESEIDNSEKQLNNNTLNSIDINKLKIDYLIELEEFYKSLFTYKYLLKDIENKDKNIDETLKLLKIELENNKSISIKEYRKIRDILESYNIEEKKVIIKHIPKINKVTRSVSLNSFKKQFGFYPFKEEGDIENYDISKVSYFNAKLNNRDFSHTNFSYNLTRCNYNDISNSNFSYTNLSSTRLCYDMNIVGTNFAYSNVKLYPQNVHNKSIKGTSFEGVNLSSCDFTDCVITGANLKNSNAKLNPQLMCKDFTGCNFENIDLSKLNFDNCIIKYANLKNTGASINLNTIKGTIEGCNLEGCKINGDFNNQSLKDTKLPKLDTIIKTGSIQNDISGLETNGTHLIGSLNGFFIAGSKLKDSYVTINPQKVKGLDLSLGDYRGCKFINLNFDGVNTNGSLFDDEIIKIISKQKNDNQYDEKIKKLYKS